MERKFHMKMLNAGENIFRNSINNYTDRRNRMTKIKITEKQKNLDFSLLRIC